MKRRTTTAMTIPTIAAEGSAPPVAELALEEAANVADDRGLDIMSKGDGRFSEFMLKLDDDETDGSGVGSVGDTADMVPPNRGFEVGGGSGNVVTKVTVIVPVIVNPLPQPLVPGWPSITESVSPT